MILLVLVPQVVVIERCPLVKLQILNEVCHAHWSQVNFQVAVSEVWVVGGWVQIW